MKVSELISLLSQCNPDSEVILHNSVTIDYEGRYLNKTYDIPLESIYRVRDDLTALCPAQDIEVNLRIRATDFIAEFDETELKRTLK